MKVDALILTRGQWLVDAIVWAGVKKPKKGRLTQKSNVGSLERYMDKMDGDTSLIQGLQRAQARSTADPRSLRHLKAFAHARTALEGHVERLEIANDKRFPMRGGTLPAMRSRRKKRNAPYRVSKGWSVSSTPYNRFRLTLCAKMDGPPRQVGTFGSRAEAEQEGRCMIAELRGTDPHPN